MATENECTSYGKCGYVFWRKARPDWQMQPLPENGDCGKKKEQCPRHMYDSEQDKEKGMINRVFHVEDTLTHKLPISDDEIKGAYPILPSRNSRLGHRLVGSGDK